MGCVTNKKLGIDLMVNVAQILKEILLLTQVKSEAVGFDFFV